MRALAVLALVACSSDPKHETSKRVPPIVVDARADVPDVPGLRLPAGVTPLAYDVRLELDPDRDTFAGRVVMRVKLDVPASKIWLHADELEIDKARYRTRVKSGTCRPTRGVYR